jgi:hypothetical protein
MGSFGCPLLLHCGRIDMVGAGRIIGRGAKIADGIRP